MFEDYRAAVYADYEKKSKEPGFSLNLLAPKPGVLQEECAGVFDDRFLKKDEPTLKLYFGNPPEGKTFEYSIDKIDIDRFRPLVTFLKNEGKTKPENKHIELLAWLIDFEARPYQTWKELQKQEETKKEKEEAISEKDAEINTPDAPAEKRSNADQEITSIPDSNSRKEGDDEQPITDGPGDKDVPVVITGLNASQNKGEKPVPLKPKRPKLMVASLAVIFILMASSTYYIIRDTGRQCMYWTGDHYERISCDENIEGATKIPYNVEVAKHLKKITRPDTLTLSAIGRVWWGKTNGQVFFYTAGGDHPEDAQKRLLPVTAYMLNKYVFAARNNQASQTN